MPTSSPVRRKFYLYEEHSSIKDKSGRTLGNEETDTGSTESYAGCCCYSDAFSASSYVSSFG